MRLLYTSPSELSVAASVCWRSRVTRAFLNRSRGDRRREGWMVQAWGHSNAAKWCIAAAAFARAVRRVTQHLSRACCLFDAAVRPRARGTKSVLPYDAMYFELSLSRGVYCSLTSQYPCRDRTMRQRRLKRGRKTRSHSKLCTKIDAYSLLVRAP